MVINYFNKHYLHIFKREWVVNFIFKILQECTIDFYTLYWFIRTNVNNAENIKSINFK